MNRIFRKATLDEVEQIYRLYIDRVKWMDEQKLSGWNTTNYLARYPIEYYAEQCRLGQLYVLREENSLLGAVVLLREDEHWSGKEKLTAYYVHNFVTMPGMKGAGSEMLEEIERMADAESLQAVRLDCSMHNETLNNYYGSRGYKPSGECNDGPYYGCLREKKL